MRYLNYVLTLICSILLISFCIYAKVKPLALVIAIVGSMLFSYIFVQVFKAIWKKMVKKEKENRKLFSISILVVNALMFSLLVLIVIRNKYHEAFSQMWYVGFMPVCYFARRKNEEKGT